MVTVEINLDIIRTILEVLLGFGGFIVYLLYKNAEADVEYYQTLWKHEQTANKTLRKQLEELEKEEGITDDE
jgi:hypothetical protein